MAKPRAVLVWWDDAGVTMTGETLTPLRTWTTGWLIRQDKHGLHIATDYVETLEDHGEARHLITWPMVVDWWYVDIEE